MALKYKRRWCLIANTIRNRSQHAIKNRFFQIVSGYLKISNKNSIKRRNFVNDLTQILLEKFNVTYVPFESEKRDPESEDESDYDSQEDQTSKKDLESSKISGSKTTETRKEKSNMLSTESETLKKSEFPEKNFSLKKEEKKTAFINNDHINKKIEMEKPKELFNFNQPLNISCQNHHQHEGTINNIFWQHYYMQRNLFVMQNFVIDSERRMLSQQFQQFSRMMGLNGQYTGNF